VKFFFLQQVINKVYVCDKSLVETLVINQHGAGRLNFQLRHASSVVLSSLSGLATNDQFSRSLDSCIGAVQKLDCLLQ
jgi:hypothetical protein